MYLLRVISDYPHCLVTEGLLKQIYPGSGAIKIGLPVDDVDADYLAVFRQLLLASRRERFDRRRGFLQPGRGQRDQAVSRRPAAGVRRPRS
jgi:hypothetical protein